MTAGTGVMSHARRYQGDGELGKADREKTVMSGEVRTDAGKGAELGTMGGEMRRVEERRIKEVERSIGGCTSEQSRKN